MPGRLTTVCATVLALVAADPAAAQDRHDATVGARAETSVERATRTAAGTPATLGVAASTGTASSTEAASSTDAASSTETAGEPEPAVAEASSSHWQPHWERFHWVEGLVTLAAEGGAVAIYFAEPSRQPRWRDPMPLDDEARELLRLAPEDRKLAITLSDGMFFPMLLWPMVIDALLLGGIVGQDWDTTWQMILIDAETMAIAHLVTWFTTRFVGRVRPLHLECSQDDSCPDRGVGPVASFVSGHSLMAYAASGLTCVHHVMNPWLTGGAEGAALMCGGSLALSTAIGVMRVMSDLHWASDVAFGAMMGSAIGWGIPLIFHYGRARPRLPGDVAIVPAAAGDAGLGVMGAF